MKQQLKKTKRDPIIMNFQNLVQSVSRAQSKNTAKYNQIKHINTQFQYKLYKPTIPSYQTRQQLGLAQQILIRQLDKLMQDEQKLNIQLDRHEIKVIQQQRKKQKQIILNMDHYTFLRTLWKKDQNQYKVIDKIDKLIHNVGAIKGHILNIIKKQNNVQSSPQIHQLIISSPEYCQLLKKYQDMKILYKQMQQKQKQQSTICNSQQSIQSQQIKKYNQQLQQQVARLKIQLENKNIQLQNMKILRNKLGQDINGISQGKKDRFYKIYSAEGAYNIYIDQIYKKCDSDRNINISENQININTNNNNNSNNISDNNNINININLKQKQKPVKQLTSKQSLQSILKFLQNGQARKISKYNDLPSQQTRGRKFTVQQIARPKFISNRNITAKNSQKQLPVL